MNYSKQIIVKNIAKIIGVLLASGILIYFSANHIISDMQTGKWTTTYILQLFIFIIGVIGGILFIKISSWSDSFFDKILYIIDNALKGNKGEKQVKAELDKFLDENKYKIYRNIKLPNKKFDIDIIVIGPLGITALEIKNWTGKFCFYENYFEKIKQKTGFTREIREERNKEKDPRNKINEYCKELKQYLDAQGADLNKINIQRAVVFVEDVAKWEGDTQTFIISGLGKLKHYFDTPKGEEMPNELRAKLTEIFDKLKGKK